MKDPNATSYVAGRIRAVQYQIAERRDFLAHIAKDGAAASRLFAVAADIQSLEVTLTTLQEFA